MFEKLEQTVKDVISIQNHIPLQILEQWSYALVFKTTHWCWNNCAHCCESSSPKQPRNFIPESVIKDYIDQAVADKKYSRAVVFTGGEIMSAYKFATPGYIPNILNHALDSGNGVDIKTNAGWTGTPIAPYVFDDIEQLVKKRAPKEKLSFKNVIPFQVSLSLDRFHKNTIERNFKFIEHFARTDMNGASFTINISSFANDRTMFSELLEKLQNAGLSVSELCVFDSTKENGNTMFDVNNNILIKYSEGTLFDGGRAKNINGAKHSELPQFQFATPNQEILVALDSFGNVTLGENSGKKISVPWCDKNGEPRPITDIRTDLVVATQAAEQEYLNQHRVLNWYFNQVRKKIVKK